MDNEGKFWIFLWAVLSVAFIVGVFPVSSCAKDYNKGQNQIFLEAVQRGCLTITDKVISGCPNNNKENK